MQIQAMDLERSLRGLLHSFGLKVGDVSSGKLVARMRELAAGRAIANLRFWLTVSLAFRGVTGVGQAGDDVERAASRPGRSTAIKHHLTRSG